MTVLEKQKRVRLYAIDLKTAIDETYQIFEIHNSIQISWFAHYVDNLLGGEQTGARMSVGHRFGKQFCLEGN